MQRLLRGTSILSAALAAIVPAGSLLAQQANVGVSVGGAARGRDYTPFHDPAFHFGAHADVMFLRQGNADVGLGPYLDVSTLDFDSAAVGAGVSFLAPVIDGGPMVFSLGPYFYADPIFGPSPGMSGSFFWGMRSFNYSAPYDMAFGLVVEGRVGFGVAEETALTVALRIDAAFLASPVVFIIDAIRGGSPEVDPVEPKKNL